MAKKAEMNIKRGDAYTFGVNIPIANWTAGGKLFFAAKVNPDNDTTDSVAVINKTYTDTAAVVGPSFVRYTCTLDAADTASIQFTNNGSKNVYKGEFQFVPTSGKPTSWPGENDYIQVNIFADIKRGTS